MPMSQALKFAAPQDDAIALHAIDADALEGWLDSAETRLQTMVAASGFKAAIGDSLVVPGPDGAPGAALVGLGTAATRSRGRFALAAGAGKLPDGTYRLATDRPADRLDEECLGWLLSCYRFGRYKTQPEPARYLVAPDELDADRIEAQAGAEALTRDLINTPANDMGPAALEQAARDLSTRFGASLQVITGDDLLTRNLPLIHTVGRAAADAPRLIDLHWGDAGPQLVLVGKGVCFDTGGLNLKPGASMALMKKDMGGAANVLGLAQMIMAQALPLRLRVLIPAVENAVGGGAFRPGDVLKSRKGLTVEINNTDAEGRLVLADALALADEDAPDLIVSMATLTGAARVAVGPDLSPFYATQERLAHALRATAPAAADPVWEMPFWPPYEAMIEPDIADLDNAPSGGFAGSITAALFLRRFVETTPDYLHFDIYGWQPRPAPARPKGGVAQGGRALFAALPEMLGL